ncbi:MAG: hypothetical protein K1000chlam2_01597 [Chlamydiae bacterium]|nr:hypothetical protein [Chlamydiota bacterium]
MTYSSLFRRLAAFAIDCIVLIGIFMLGGLILGISLFAAPFLALPMLGFWYFGGLLFLAWFYYAGFESSRWQATIGKKMLGLKVVNLKGNRIGFWRATVRYFSKLLSRLILMFGFLMIFFTKKKQALHDKIARTLIIHR